MKSDEPQNSSFQKNFSFPWRTHTRMHAHTRTIPISIVCVYGGNTIKKGFKVEEHTHTHPDTHTRTIYWMSSL